ncbi:branched-chain amino acid aminotransferase [Bradyrhizobium sp. U87765 SZCCT0131]|uniref:branched-chain amino acid aminotransferase n=1 Tax=unclassified Bradyrhizobium TaxID=2631580 RepID=UPI001BA90365|nr:MULTISPECIES: branched-chain amino acid aminotransferase [unclassified Bradyrhizobium]MBR1218190.1 branched-chain amino acid aminotransferase [Bradyrhizobium sp. U87765 SZCCT0131]MBR1260864.1 branched-chain amino acid aminotransferase [Bradyrhizobium sp. U87765 SZCCT0134]MBR1303688.1 branched-chain amino acid aminotransferase [Bradyrhizobium sp. U87765 SZCCT0110]MBR1319294.1 branched-chain amino acid aminotransferase [Bradyrhizobium sp. U87765 SZCCT0109]MBR1347619.1 branched-chain amino aci
MNDLSKTTFTRHPTDRPVPADVRAGLLKDPGFGKVFSDHMVTIRWTKDGGWHDAQVRARAPISLDPAAAVLHYGQEIFEGLKAYNLGDGSIALFRPDQNARRFQSSAARMAMPELPEAMFLQAVDELVKIDSAWIPKGDGSLYLRPFMFATEAFLGVRPSYEYLFILIASSVGSYFKGGEKPVTVWLTDRYTRAAEGGTGAAKCGGNYASSLLAQAEAMENGCDQVVFLDAAEHRWVEELGGMNVFLVMDDGSLVTPPLSGTILPGITRDAIITLARKEGRTVREERYSIDQWRADAASGKLKEAFACGTAAVVASIGKIKSSKGDIVVADGTTGPVTAAIKAKLVGIQRGDVADEFGWVHRIR